MPRSAAPYSTYVGMSAGLRRMNRSPIAGSARSRRRESTSSPLIPMLPRSAKARSRSRPLGRARVSGGVTSATPRHRHYPGQLGRGSARTSDRRISRSPPRAARLRLAGPVSARTSYRTISRSPPRAARLRLAGPVSARTSYRTISRSPRRAARLRLAGPVSARTSSHPPDLGAEGLELHLEPLVPPVQVIDAGHLGGPARGESRQNERGRGPKIGGHHRSALAPDAVPSN